MLHIVNTLLSCAREQAGWIPASAIAPCIALGSGILLRSTSPIHGLVPPAWPRPASRALRALTFSLYPALRALNQSVLVVRDEFVPLSRE